MNNIERLQQLKNTNTLPPQELEILIDTYTQKDREYAAELARDVSFIHFGKSVYIRGIIEFSNYCRCNCLYCGLRKDNLNVHRYRLDVEEIMNCCKCGYALGFRTFVLQSGEDKWYTDQRMTDIVRTIHSTYPDCAITLSIGELSYSSYKKFFDAGANRFLLRHETATPSHYEKLHPMQQTLENRLQCLENLKEIGYQIGAGMMVGSPYQTTKHLVNDLIYMEKIKPQMIGIGPFLPHHETPFRDFKAGSIELTLLLLSVIRLMHPRVLLPATTALEIAKKCGRIDGIFAGANVIMPNISPQVVRRDYMLYDNKDLADVETVNSVKYLDEKLKKIGYHAVIDRGDYPIEEGSND